MKLALADRNETKLKQVKEELAGTLGDQNIMCIACDVSKLDDVQKLKELVFDTWGEVCFHINHAF